MAEGGTGCSDPTLSRRRSKRDLLPLLWAVRIDLIRCQRSSSQNCSFVISQDLAGATDMALYLHCATMFTGER